MHKPSNNRSLIWFCAAGLMKKKEFKKEMLLPEEQHFNK
jgi:hypothetical protein